MTDRTLAVLEPGPLTTVQDRGRPGWAHLGVPRSGALDAPAAALANRLVGNPAAAAVLELTFGGLGLRASTAMTVAVTGAPAPVTVGGRAVAFGEPVTLAAGSALEVGPPTSGVRSYVAVSGGICVDPVLGSRSTDLLSGLGPAQLAAGQVLPVGPPLGEPAAVDVTRARAPARPVVLRLRPGPRTDWFTGAAIATLTGSTYTVGSASNRVGLRLSGPALERRRDPRLPDELPSEGLVTGAVQVPASGRPLVFLADHPTTGGYPVIGVVDEDSVTACAQLRPDDVVRFRL